MGKWQVDPELYLYCPHTRNPIVQTWRCKITTSTLLAPLIDRDFNDQGIIMSLSDLARPTSSWNQVNYDKLLDYITEKHFLVNCQGLVFEELYEFDFNELITRQKRIYVRLHDVIKMSEFGLPDPLKIPFRTVRYLNYNMEAAVDPSPNEVKLALDLDIEKRERKAVEVKLATSEAKNRALESTNQALEAAKRALESENQALRRRLADLEGKKHNNHSDNKSVGGGSVSREPWMNTLTNGNWVGVGGLKHKAWANFDLPETSIGKAGDGFSFNDRNTTNVLHNYFYRPTFGKLVYDMNIVLIDELNPNREKARFDPNVWTVCSKGGRMYVGTGKV